MKNFEVARLFALMADLLEIRDENPFRIRAYRRAAQSLESLAEDVEAMAAEGRLDEIPGIGKDLAGKIAEYLATGRMKDVEALRRSVPPGVVELMSVPGIGPKTARLLHEQGGATDIGRLEALARAGKLRGLPGIQARTEANILEGIAVVRKGLERMPLGRALPLGEEIARALARHPEVLEVSLAGSIRRGKETVGDIDVIVASSRPAGVMEAFVSLPQAAAVLEQGETRSAIRHLEGVRVDLRVVEPASFGAALQYFTGSKQHNIRIREMAGRLGLKISEYGVFREPPGRRVAGATEEEVYRAVGLPWIPPELREDAGEVEAAIEGRLPALVAVSDIRGDLHCHTKATDGSYPPEAVVEAARRRGYEYVAITDHSRSALVARGLGSDEMLAHAGRIRALRARYPDITVLAGCECDILPDGAMDYPDEVLARLDLVVAAVHGRFKQGRAAMTRRIVRALANPHVHVLAHPTGRVIGERAPYDVDLDEVLRAAVRHRKAVEVNAYPLRLDLSDVHARRAHDLGALVAIDTDLHVLAHLDNVRLGVVTARRGWTERPAVVNTWPAKRLLAWLGGARRGKG